MAASSCSSPAPATTTTTTTPSPPPPRARQGSACLCPKQTLCPLQVRLALFAATYVIIPFRSTTVLSPPKRSVRRRRRRQLNVEETMKAYSARIQSPEFIGHLHELEGAYLSTFNTFTTESNIVDHRPHHTNNAYVLMKIAREHNVNVKAVTSECKINGKYRAALLGNDTRENAKVVYVGNYNYFTRHQETKWSVLPQDKVYYNLE